MGKSILSYLFIFGGILSLLWFYVITKLPIHGYLFGNNIIRGENVLNNEAPREKYCKEHFSHGAMCPTPYSQLAPCELEGDGTWQCPDVRHMAATNIRKTQLVLTRMLRIFDLVARKRSIPYWMRSGTLIGAIRHQGFVPWDDDIDIEIPLMNYDDFVKAVSEELPEDILFQMCNSDNYCGQWNSNDVTERFNKKEARLKLRDKSSCYKYCFQHGCKWHDGLQVDVFIHNGSLNGIFPLREMQFEGFNFLVSNNWEDVISAEYPGFRQLPEKSERVPKNNETDPLHSCGELSLDQPNYQG